MTISWHTDLPSDSQIEYGVSSQLGEASSLSTVLATSHSITLTGLQQDSNYFYRVVSKPAGALAATASGNHEFNTLAVPGLTTVPTDVMNIEATNVGTSTARITWTTDKNASGRVFYGITTSYPQESELNLTPQASHSFLLANLTPSVLYHYHVQSIDAANNIVYSDDHTFTTASLSLSVSSGNTTSTSGVGIPASVTLAVSETDETSASLAWHVNSAEGDITTEYDIRYSTASITENNFANATPGQSTLVTYEDLAANGTARTYIIAGLNADTTYYFAIKARYAAGAWSAISNVPAGATLAVNTPQTPLNQAPDQNNFGGSGGGISSAAGPSIHVNAGSSVGIRGPIAPPTTIIAAGENGQIVFSWNDPEETSFVRTIIVKNPAGYPASPSDGQIVYEGDGETFTDTNVSNGTTYYYSFYAYDHAKHYSKPISISLVPKAGVNEIALNATPSVTTGVEYHFTTVLKKGDTVPEVAHLQGMLVRYGYYPEKLVTSYFGSLTEIALKHFQAAHGVAATGLTDAKTQILLNAASLTDATMNVPQEIAIFETDLRPGMSGEKVAALQQFLAYEGSYAEAQITGTFGPLTQRAVIAFQKKYNIIPAVGYVGPITRHTIEVISGF